MMQSLRTRLIVGIAACTALLLVGSGLVVYMLLRQAMLSEIDRSLTSEVHLLIPLIEYDRNGVDLDVGSLAEKVSTSADNLVQLWMDDGTVVRRSAGLKNRDMQQLPVASDNLQISQSRLDDNTPIRYAQISFDVLPEASDASLSPCRVTLGVARQISPLQQRLAEFRTVLLVSFAGIILFAALIVVIVVTVTLQPIGRLGQHIAQLDHDKLKQKVTHQNMPSEIVPVVDRLNELLQRLDAAFERERGFTGDVAHELRTPLAGMRSIMEVTASRPRQVNEYQQALSDVYAVLIGMEEMVDKLLMLARLDAEQITPQYAIIALKDIIEPAWQPIKQTAQARHLTFQNDVSPNLSVTADRNLIQMIMSNLLGNAVTYTNENGLITLQATYTSEHIIISLTNTGCHLQSGDIVHASDRFWRGDSARGGTGMHSGLGLSLVQRAVDLMHGTFDVQITDDACFTVTFCLPNETT